MDEMTESLKSVTIETQEDGSFMVGGEMATTIDEALEMARMMLSSEEAPAMSESPKEEEAEAAAAAFAMGRGK